MRNFETFVKIAISAINSDKNISFIQGWRLYLRKAFLLIPLFLRGNWGVILVPITMKTLFYTLTILIPIVHDLNTSVMKEEPSNPSTYLYLNFSRPTSEILKFNELGTHTRDWFFWRFYVIFSKVSILY